MAALPKVAFFVRIFALSPKNMETKEPGQEPQITAEAKQKAKQITLMRSLSFAIQFGFMIVIPLLVFAFAGKWLSTRYDNPIYFYAGLILALTVSTAWFYKRISDLYKDFID